MLFFLSWLSPMAFRLARLLKSPFNEALMSSIPLQAAVREPACQASAESKGLFPDCPEVNCVYMAPSLKPNFSKSSQMICFRLQTLALTSQGPILTPWKQKRVTLPSISLPKLHSSCISDMCKCFRGFQGLCQNNQAPASHSVPCNITTGRYGGESFWPSSLWAGQRDRPGFKWLLFIRIVRLGQVQSLSLKHIENKIKPFSAIKLVVITMAYSSMGMRSFLLRQRQKWTLIRLCSTTVTGAAVSSRPRSRYVSPRQ